MSADDAWEEALRQFGDTEKFRAEVREIDEPWEGEMRRAEWFDSIVQDLGYALRQLLKSKGFSAVAILTLALGIGATTTVFSVVSAVILRPLPFDEADELVTIREVTPQGETFSTSEPNYLDFANAQRSFAEMAALTGGSVILKQRRGTHLHQHQAGHPPLPPDAEKESVPGSFLHRGRGPSRT